MYYSTYINATLVTTALFENIPLQLPFRMHKWHIINFQNYFQENTKAVLLHF